MLSERACGQDEGRKATEESIPFLDVVSCSTGSLLLMEGARS